MPIGLQGSATYNWLKSQPSVTSLPKPPTDWTRNTAKPVTTAPAAPYVVNQYRVGDYLYVQYSNGKYEKRYSPTTIRGPRNTTGTTGTTAGTNRGVPGSTGPTSAVNQAKTNAGGTPMTGIPGGVPTAGGPPPEAGGSSGDVAYDETWAGPSYGWTANMTPTDIGRGLDYPMRILQQVTGTDLTQRPGFTGFMSPYTMAINNPFTQLLLNPGISTQPGQDITGSGQYNFQADALKQMMTPGAGFLNLGTALENMQQGLGNNESGIYDMLMGSIAGQTGSNALGASFDIISQMLEPILQLTGSPLQRMLTNARISNLMNTYLLNNNDQSEEGLTFLLRNLGYPVTLPAGPRVGSTGASPTNPGAAGYGG